MLDTEIKRYLTSIHKRVGLYLYVVWREYLLVIVGHERNKTNVVRKVEVGHVKLSHVLDQLLICQFLKQK